MGEAHTIWHQITTLLGIKQCTATQVLGICMEFWVGAGVAAGLIKVKALKRIGEKLEKLTGGKEK